MPGARKDPHPSLDFLLADAGDADTARTLQRLEDRATAAEQQAVAANQRAEEDRRRAVAADHRAEEADRRAADAQDDTRKHQFETTKTFLVIIVALFSIGGFIAGRLSAHWMDLNSELRAVRERIAVVEALQGRAASQTQPTASAPSTKATRGHPRQSP